MIILRYIRNENLSYSKRILKFQNYLQKTSFFLYFRRRPKNGKGDVETICARVTKPASKKVAKAEVDLNSLWTIDYELFWLYIYIHEQFSLFDTSTNVLTVFLISLLQHLLQEYEEHEN